MKNPPPGKWKEKAFLLRSTALSGFCSLIPVPFVDDILIRKVRKGLVHRIVRDHGNDKVPTEFRSLYQGPKKGCLAGSIGFIFLLVKKLLKKLFRTVFFFLAVRTSAMEMAETYLMGHTLDRILQKDKDPLHKGVYDSESMGLAFREAFKGTDRRVLAVAFSNAKAATLSSGKLLRRLARRKDSEWASNDEIQPEQLPERDRTDTDQLAGRIDQILKKKEVTEFLKEFDERVDNHLSASLLLTKADS